jgi:hypothetical protein
MPLVYRKKSSESDSLRSALPAIQFLAARTLRGHETETVTPRCRILLVVHEYKGSNCSYTMVIPNEGYIWADCEPCYRTKKRGFTCTSESPANPGPNKRIVMYWPIPTSLYQIDHIEILPFLFVSCTFHKIALPWIIR